MTHTDVDWLCAAPPRRSYQGAGPCGDGSIPHRVRELAIAYGLGARAHHGERHWEDICDQLAVGWERLCGREPVPWAQVESDVEGAWRLVQTG